MFVNPRSNLLCLILQSTCISTHIDPLYLRLIPSLFVVHSDFMKTSTYILSTVKLKNVQSDPIRSTFSASNKIESSPLDSSGSPLFYFCFLFSLLSSLEITFFPVEKKKSPKMIFSFTFVVVFKFLKADHSIIFMAVPRSHEISGRLLYCLFTLKM